MSDKTVREILFKPFKGCSDHGCLITGPKGGMGTNGGCRCVINMSRSQLHILQSKLHVIANMVISEERNV